MIEHLAPANFDCERLPRLNGKPIEGSPNCCDGTEMVWLFLAPVFNPVLDLNAY